MQPSEIGVNGDIQDLAFLIGHRTGNQESGDAVVGAVIVDQSHLAIEGQIVLGLPLRRFGGGVLDRGYLGEVALLGGANAAPATASDPAAARAAARRSDASRSFAPRGFGRPRRCAAAGHGLRAESGWRWAKSSG